MTHESEDPPTWNGDFAAAEEHRREAALSVSAVEVCAGWTKRYGSRQRSQRNVRNLRARLRSKAPSSETAPSAMTVTRA